MIESSQTIPAIAQDRSVWVIGAGTMGMGIVEVAATAGHTVYVQDRDVASVGRGLGLIRASLDKRVSRGKISSLERDTILNRVAPAPAQIPPEVGLVIEAIYEDLEAKVQALGAVETMLASDAIIATNTSSLSVTAIGRRLAVPERVVGMHFFNPAPALPLVEVVGGHATSHAVVQRIVATAKAWGKTPVQCRSTPGFIVNRIARPYYGEALRLLQECAGSAATLDAVFREAGGFRMGPFELMDMIGHDVNFAVTKSVFSAFFQDPRYQPSLVQGELVDAGWLGRKAGRGFYDYRDGSEPVHVSELSAGPAPQNIRIEGRLGVAEPLLDRLTDLAGTQLTRVSGHGMIRVDGLCLALTDGRTAAERAAEMGEPVALFDLALDYTHCARMAITVSDPNDFSGIQKAAGFFAALGIKAVLLDDVPGLAVMRTVVMLINEGAEALYQGVASEEDIDVAMRLGVNYPLGPLAWGRQVGLPLVLQVLLNLQRAYGEDRYRASAWLQREVQRGAIRRVLEPVSR